MAKIILVAAMGINGGIGKDNKLPWDKSIPADIEHFKEITLGKVVVMGRKTWESIPPKYRPLPGRENIVLTRDVNFVAEGARVVHDINAIRQMVETMDVYVIGGSEIYSAFEPFATLMYLTVINWEFDCDTYFLSYDPTGWEESECIFVPMCKQTSYFNIAFVTLKRISPTA